MRKILILIFVSSIFIECEANPKGKDSSAINVTVRNQLPIEIIHLRAEKQYDLARWLIYCIHCDETVNFSPQSKYANVKGVSFGTLPLVFNNVQLRGDSIEINFRFNYRDILIDYPTVSNYLIYGVAFKHYTDSIAYFHSVGDMPYFSWHCDNIDDCTSRYVKPLQPEVIKYIKENKNKLDPWFRKEAIKRGVISE